jgi:hypothetical protein
MRRPVLIATLWAVALWPAGLEAQFRYAQRRVDRYFRVPLAGAPYSLQPADVFQPFIYASPIYTVQPYGSIPNPVRDSNVHELLHEVNRLRREVRRLHEERRPSRQSLQTPPEPPQSTEQPSLSLMLVFHDGRQIEVQGYAIVGQTLWAFTENRSTTIPIADLDLEATQRLNADRGARLPLPRKP